MRRGTRPLPAIVGMLVVLTALPLGQPASAAAASSDLFFSEYVEGTSNNKALEIYNGTGSPVDLGAAGYNVQMWFNGNAFAGLTINLSGTVADGDVFVLAQASADPAILAVADQTNGSGWFNGNDAVVLRKGATFIDVIGQVGFNPGIEWGSGNTSTADNTLRRKSTITAGDPEGADAFDPSVEWDGYPTNTFDGLGSHTVASSGSPNLVISQVYGGGGNSGAPFDQDFIEIFNGGSSPVSLAGMSLQYASATGSGAFGGNSGQLTELPNLSVAAGQYVLVGEAQGATGAVLPTVDVSDATPINMSAGNGKVALVSDATSLGCNGGSIPCDSSQLARIVDLVGYGSANFYEGSGAAPGLSNTTADFRAAQGCQDTDDNAADFAAATPSARNTASPLHICGAVVDSAPTVTSTTPANGATDVPIGSNISIDFSEAVDVSSGWFDITCDLSGSHSATASGGPSSFTLDPDANFSDGDNCTVTLYAAQITDQDTNDPPDNMAADYLFTFDAADVCLASFTPIYTIQGAGMASPLAGTSQTTQGIVVGSFEGGASNSGFYIQDAAGDGDAATSDGIFVYEGNTIRGVSPGDVVRISGNVSEYFGMTEMSVSSFVSCGTAAPPTPVDVTLPFANADFPERYEGMLVRLPQSLVISEYFNYDRFGEIVLAEPLDGESRPYTPTAVDAPGAAANARAEANALSRITLDDNVSASNPPVLRHPNGQPFSLGNRFRGGDVVANTTGAMGYAFGLYRIYPTQGADYSAVNPRPTHPTDVGGSLHVGSMNTLNFFVTLDDGTHDICGPAQDQECRGADSPSSSAPNEFERQRAKLLAAIEGLNADVLGLNELENTTGVEPLANIVDGLNADLGAGTYAYIDTGTIGTDAIKVGLIYKPAMVTPMGGYAILDSSVDPRFIDTKNRPALAQTFEENATGAVFTVVVNHLKSKGSDCNDLGDPDTGDGQGNCNVTRTLAAQALADWIATDPTASGDPDFLIVGDLNSYAMEDPITALKAGSDDHAGTGDDFTNLIAKYGDGIPYSYVFDGQSGYLDYALGSSSMSLQVTGATEWHINADEPDILDYDETFKPPEQEALYEPNAYRSSDHDPVLVGLDLAPEAGWVTGGSKFADVKFAVDTTDATHFMLPDKQKLDSTSYDWLVIQGDRADLQGEATLNGAAGYSYRFVVIDNGAPGSNDLLRLVVWDASDSVVYDSQSGDALTAAPTANLKTGNVTIH